MRLLLLLLLPANAAVAAPSLQAPPQVPLSDPSSFVCGYPSSLDCGSSFSASSTADGLEKYFLRHQRRTQAARERAELLGRVNGDSAHVLRICDDESQEMQFACNSSRMIEEVYSTAVDVLSKFSEQREHMKSAQRKALDILNTAGLSNSVLKLIERRNRMRFNLRKTFPLLTRK